MAFPYHAFANVPRQSPEHACAYCGISNPECVVFCNTSKKWFCNGAGKQSGSHIVLHLSQARTNEITLHKNGLFKSAVKCGACGLKNVFLLGFISVGENEKVLLCRNSCAPRDTAVKLNPSAWQPIIQDRQFVPWLVKVPSLESRQKAFNITTQEITRLEELWRDNPQASIKDLKRCEFDDKLDLNVIRYKDFHQYERIFKALVCTESNYDRRIKESLKVENVMVRWHTSKNGKQIAYFPIPGANEGSDLRIMLSDELIIRRSDDPEGEKKNVGYVVKIPDNYNEDFGVEMDPNIYNSNYPGPFVVTFKWKSISFDRMRRAIDLVSRRLCQLPGHMFDRILGLETGDIAIKSDLPSNYNAPGLNELNPSQISAVKAVLQRSLSLIQGPPGTGKTVTSASIIYHLNQLTRRKVLVVAPSNTAVDQLCEKVNLTGLKVVRVYARSRESMASSVSHLALHVQMRQDKAYPQLLEFQKLDEAGKLSSTDKQRYFALRREIEGKILMPADVICCTCVTAGDRRLKDLEFQAILYDEATQATEPECLIPLTLGCRQVILVGDHCQLGPVVTCEKAAEAGLGQSLFERFVLMGIQPNRLQVQYRMHPALSAFPSKVFYEGSLRDGVTAKDRSPKMNFPWPDPDRPTFFYATSGQEEISGNGLSYVNRTEAATVEKILTTMLRIRIPASTIGVITPYEGQRIYLTHHLRHFGKLDVKLYQKVEIASVDTFQGREKDYIILSCVRANEKQGVGFLNDPRRLNVSLTRAKYGLIIVGNPKTLCKQRLWNDLLHFYRDQHLLVEGSLDSLSEYNLQSSKPTDPYVYKPQQQLVTREATGSHTAHFHRATDDINSWLQQSLAYLGRLNLNR